MTMDEIQPRGARVEILHWSQMSGGTHGPCDRCGHPLGAHTVVTQQVTLNDGRRGVKFVGWACP